MHDGARCPRCNSKKDVYLVFTYVDTNACQGYYCRRCLTEFTRSGKILEPLEEKDESAIKKKD